jgi:hypothetical protein
MHSRSLVAYDENLWPFGIKLLKIEFDQSADGGHAIRESAIHIDITDEKANTF